MEHVENAEENKSRLNAMVAITIALLATFLGICKVKDDNICQAMQAAQTDRLDAWSAFNTKSTEAKVLEGNAITLDFQAASATGPAKASLTQAAKKMGEHVTKEEQDKDDWQKKAKDAEDTYEKLNYRDDQFDFIRHPMRPCHFPYGDHFSHSKEVPVLVRYGADILWRAHGSCRSLQFENSSRFHHEFA